MRQALELALEVIQDYVEEYGPHDKDSGAQYTITAIKEALAQPDQDEVDIRSRLYQRIHELETQLAQPEQRAQLLFEVDGEMLTASQMMGIELFNFQQATGCDTAAEFLAQPEQEPVGKFAKFTDGIWREVTDGSAGVPLYTTPPQRTWVGLTDEEENEYNYLGPDMHWVIQEIEAKLKEKNT